MKKILSTILIVLLIYPTILTFIPPNNATAATTPKKTQSVKTSLLSSDTRSLYQPIVYWTQKDNGDFHAGFTDDDGTVVSRDADQATHTDGSHMPKKNLKTRLTYTIDLAHLVPAKWKYEGKDIDKSLLTDIEVDEDSVAYDPTARTYTGIGTPAVNGTKIKITTETGDYPWSDNIEYAGNGKWQTSYETPLLYKFKANLTETKEIDVNPNSSVKAGTTKQLNASVRTKEKDQASFGSWVSVASDTSKTQWKSLDESIATVSPTGLVSAIKVGTVEIQATWRSGEYEIWDTATITVTAGDPPPDETEPPEYAITGDFDIVPNQINFRESFAFKPKNFVIPAECNYVNHRYVIRRDGSFSLSDYVTNRTQTTSYAYSNYPNVIGVGTHEVSIKITATCAGKTIETDWLNAKNLIVNGPSGNRPPVFTAGFFEEPDLYSFEPQTEVVVNHKVNLRIINDLREDPPTPNDPDGDPISYTWDFASSSSSWIKSFPSEYGAYANDEQIRWIIATELGRHCVNVTARDPYGGSSTKNVCVNVIPENPVPLIDAPKEVIEGRPLAFPISGSRSYSPMKRAIASYIWTNKQDKYTTPGTEIISLDVIDSTGLKSLSPASHSLLVKPDLPPIPKLDFVPITLRNIAVEFTNSTYSPDYDQIVINTVTYRYDSDNDGNFAEETSSPIMTDNAVFKFTPTKVGKYAFTVFAKEDWGKTATKDFILSVTNESPEVDFSALSVNPEPPEISVISPTMNTLMNSAAWKASTVSEASTMKNYRLDATNNSLETAWVSNFLPYKSITTNNVSISTQDIYRSYCGRCGNTGSVSGYYYNFDPNLRMDRRLWANMNLNAAISSYYLQFYDEERPGAYGPYGLNPVTTGLGKGGYGSTYVNLSTGYIWQRINPQEYSRYSHTWEDNIYRISDIKNYVPGTQSAWENIVSIQPIQTYTNTISTPVSSLPSQLTPPAMPSNFTMPTPLINGGASMQVLRTDGTGASVSSTTVQSNFNKDGLGNEYKDKCIVNTYPQYIVSCSLAKYNASGQALWVSPVAFTSYEATVQYVSSDSSKIIAFDKYTGSSWLLNNTDGSVISKLTPASGSTFANNVSYYSSGNLTDSNIYLGVYNDVIAYISQTVEAGFMTTVGRKANWELKFYNLVTGETTSAGNIKSYVGKTGGGYDSGYNVGTFKTANPASVISADGKLIIANYYSNVLIYDMATFSKEGDISTGLSEPLGYSSRGSTGGNYDHRYGVKGMSLTEDGRLKIVYRESSRSTSCGDSGDCDDSESYSEKALTIQTTPSTDNSYSYGYISGTDTITNGDLSLKVKFIRNIYSDQHGVGVGFRSQDNKNMYKVEVSTGQVNFVKVVNGVRTILASYAYPIKAEQTYDLKVKVRGTKVKVYMNGVPIIEKADSTFTAGTFGLFAEVPFAVLKDFSAAIYELTGDEVENLAIVNAPITYNKTYSDLENDPLISNKTKWKFTNIQPYKFLNVGDGTSDPVGTNSYNGVIVQQPSPSLSKVGVYSVDLVETDDPAPSGFKHPSTAFKDFQKESDPANHNIVVHRRPISDFTLSISPADHSVVWTELGYDPDRWFSPTNYSTEATGIDYKTTRGVLERRYYYIDPNGNKVDQKLVAPPIAGDYIVAETVRDEYGAWSDWAEDEITIITPVINKPPAAEITMPASTDQNNPTKFAVLRPTFTWTYNDPDGDIQTQYELRIMRYGATLLLSSGIKTGAVTSWIPTTDLPAGTNLYVQVRVYDGMEWSNWSAPKYFYINRPPVLDFDWSPKPVYEGDIVQFSTTVSDPDNDTLAVGYEITSPNGAKQVYSSTFYSPYSQHAGPSIRMQATGTWTIKMTISDAKAPAVTVTKIVRVEALGVTGAVKHTEAWESNRLAYNEKYDPDRPSGTFWAGEAFVLEAIATDTGTSGTKAASVTVSAFGGQPKALVSTDAAKTRWSALYRSADTDIDFTQLADGTYTFVFTATYTNGTVKTDAVTITIDESADAYATVHRLH